MPKSGRRAKSVKPTVIWLKDKENPTQKAYQILTSLLRPKSVRAKGPTFAEIWEWASGLEKELQTKEFEDTLHSTTLGLYLILTEGGGKSWPLVHLPGSLWRLSKGWVCRYWAKQWWLEGISLRLPTTRATTHPLLPRTVSDFICRPSVSAG